MKQTLKYIVAGINLHLLVQDRSNTILISCTQKIILVEDKIPDFVNSCTIYDISFLTYIYSFQ